MENMSTDAHKTAHTMQSASKKLRHIFTDEQLHALEAEWNAGLTSVKDGRRIESLANSLNLTVQQIRDWIGNKRQRQKQSIQQTSVSSSASKPVPMQLKGPSGYNLFCKGKSLEPSSSGPTFRQWANEWKHLPASDKAKYTETAEEQRKNVSASVDIPKLIKHHLTLISQSCEALNDVGINIGGLFTDHTRRVGVFGNMRAYKFFQNFEWKDQFLSSMMDSQTNSSPEVDAVKKKYVSQVRHIFNDCWAKATGNTKVPYKTIKNNLYQVQIKNLPNGVKFRDPSSMGLSTLKDIINARDSLELSVTRTNKVATSTSLDEPCRLNQDQVEIPNEIHCSLEDDVNQTAFLPTQDHKEVPNIMQESLEDEGKQKAFVSNPVEAELLMDITDSEDTNSVIEIMEPSTSNWFEVEKILKTKKKGKGKQFLIKWKGYEKPTWEPEHNIRKPQKLQEKD